MRPAWVSSSIGANIPQVLDEVAISSEVDFHEGGNGSRGIIGTIVHHGCV